MPLKSKSSWRFMQMVKNNPEKMKNKPRDLSPQEASEMISKTPSYKSLPEKVKKKK